MRFFSRSELRDVWADEPRMILAYRKIWDASPILRRFYRDVWGYAMPYVRGSPVIELGGGAGFIRECYPEVISTDFLPFPESDLVCDATRLPFAAESIGSFVAVAFFHHCRNPRRLFAEVSRALAPGGRFIIFDPYISVASKVLYRFGTVESVDLNEAPLKSEEGAGESPLLEANVARATILFERNRAVFEEAFPNLRVVRIERENLFRHIAAGSCVQKSPFPDWCYPVACLLDRFLEPFRRFTGMCLVVVLEKG